MERRKEFRQIRIDLNLTQQKLADLMGLTQQQINRIENSNPGPRKIHMKFIRALKEMKTTN